MLVKSSLKDVSILYLSRKRSTSDIEYLNCDKLQIDRILCGKLLQRVVQTNCMVVLPDGPGGKGIRIRKET